MKFLCLLCQSDDRDLDIDDMFVSKAARRQEEDRAAIHDKAAAIFGECCKSKTVNFLGRG